VVIEPPAQLRGRRVAEVDAGVIVGVEGDALEGIAVAVAQPDRLDLGAGGDRVAVEAPEQRGRDRPVEAAIVEEDLEAQELSLPAHPDMPSRR
jgi:hypothetical protein